MTPNRIKLGPCVGECPRSWGGPNYGGRMKTDFTESMTMKLGLEG